MLEGPPEDNGDKAESGGGGGGDKTLPDLSRMASSEQHVRACAMMRELPKGRMAGKHDTVVRRPFFLLPKPLMASFLSRSHHHHYTW